MSENSKKMRKLYDAIIENQYINQEKLLSLGFTINDIKSLIGNNTLVQIDNNLYHFVALEQLSTYGINLLNSEYIDRGIECLETCYKLNPNDINISLKLIYGYLKRKNFSKIFEIFKSIDNNPEADIQSFNNVILYLLSLIYNYPEEYQKRILSMNVKDITLTNDSEDYNSLNQNKIRNLIMQHKFKSALNQIDSNNKDIHNLLLIELLNKASEAETRVLYLIQSLIEQKDYNTVISLIEKKRAKNKITLYQSFIYYIIKKILIIKGTRKIPTVKVTNAETLKEALLGDNFQLAMQLNLHRTSSLTEGTEKHLINMLLQEINKLINEIKKEEIQQTLLFKNMILSIIKNNKDAIKSLKDYLKQINRSEYESIVFNLIKLDCRNNDDNLSLAISFLINISKPALKFNIDIYIKKFYEYLNQNKLDIAKIYLDIINVYTSTNKIDDYQEAIEKMLNAIENISKEKEYILHILDQLKKSDTQVVEILEVSEEQKTRIISIINDIKELSIIAQNDTSISIKYYNRKDFDTDLNQFLPLGLKAYYAGEYQESIDIYHQMLKGFNPTRPKVYAMIGLSYIKIGNRNLAIKYLTIANDVNKSSDNYNKCYKFDKLIACLKAEPNEETEKKIEKYIARFNSSLSNYNLDMLEDIAYFIKINNIPLEEAATSFRLNKNHLNIIKLVFAKYHYIIEDYANGDALYAEVEQSKDQNGQVIMFLAKVKNKREFYKVQRLHLPKGRKVE